MSTNIKYKTDQVSEGYKNHLSKAQNWNPNPRSHADKSRNEKDQIARQADVLLGNGKVYRRSVTRLAKLLAADEIPDVLPDDLPPIPAMPEGPSEEGACEEE